MKVVISGSSGLVGTALVSALREAGDEVLRLVRDPEQADAPNSALWDPEGGELEPGALTGAEAVVNLNGRNIGGGRWTQHVKEELWSSRIDATRTLAAAISAATAPPRVLVNASAVGYYGDRDDEILDESADAGEGFLASLTRAWEDEAAAARSDSTRVVMLRFAMILGDGGALAKMLPPFRLGLGGPIGSGDQFWPWISLDDVVAAIRFAVTTPGLTGPVNVAAPDEVRCRDFARILGSVLGRPAVLPMPAFAAKIALGEMAEELLLASARVRPAALERHGFSFTHPRLEGALRAIL